MRNLSLAHLRTLRAVAAEGSLIGASKVLGMTPAALTARVKALESGLELELFDRTSAGLRLNAAGMIALEAADGVESAARHFIELMKSVRQGHGGRLAVGAVSTAKYFFPRLIAAFIEQRPQLDLRLVVGNRDQTLEALRSSEVEIALMGRPPADLPVEKTSIGEHPYVIIAPARHPFAKASRIDRSLLVGEPFLLREVGSGTRSLFEYFLGDSEVRGISVALELGSNETIKQAVMAGLGLALISAHTVAAEVADKRLVVLDVVGLPIVRHWFVTNRADRPLSAVGTAFRAFAQTEGKRFLPEIG